MAAWSQKTWKKLSIFAFFGNDPLWGNFQNSVLKFFIATPIDVLCSNFMKWGWREIGEIVRYLPDKKKKISPGSPALATAWIVPKIFQGQPRQCTQECSRFYPNWFTFGGVISECVNTIRVHFKVNPVFCWSLALSQINMIYSMTDHKYWNIQWAMSVVGLESLKGNKRPV